MIRSNGESWQFSKLDKSIKSDQLDFKTSAKITISEDPELLKRGMKLIFSWLIFLLEQMIESWPRLKRKSIKKQ